MKNFLLLLLAIVSFGAVADNDVGYSFGLKNWNHTMVAPQKTSLAVNSPLLSGSIKYKDFSFTASSLLQTTYVDTSQTSILAVRTDTEYAIGYTLFDRVTLLIGNKLITNPAAKDMTGVFYGVSAFQPLNEGDFIYGAMALSNTVSNLDGLGGDGKYSLVELGYGYRINKNTSINLGYRQQILISPYDNKYTLGGVTFGVGFNF